MKKISKFLVMVMMVLAFLPMNGNIAFAETATTWNPNDKSPSIGLTNGNLTAASITGGDWHSVRSTTSQSTGKWYAEHLVGLGGTGQSMIGIANSSCTLISVPDSNGVEWFSKGQLFSNGWIPLAMTYEAGDVIGTALDCDAKTISFYKNGVLIYTHTYSFTGNIFLMASSVDLASTFTTNFGATPFKYSVPNGYLAFGNNSIVPVTKPQIKITAPEKVNSGETFDIFISAENMKNIYAEDFMFNFQNTAFEFIASEEVSEKQDSYHDSKKADGFRVILASKSEETGIQAPEKLFKVTLKALNVEKGQVSITNALIADHLGIETIPEMDVKEILINHIDADVNGDGKYSLGDLAMASFNKLKEKIKWSTVKADVDKSGVIDDFDLKLIVGKILN